MSTPPLVAIPARFSATASAHRYRALSTARALSEGVLRAETAAITAGVILTALRSGLVRPA